MAIDNFSEFLETFGNPAGKDDGNSVFGQFIALARQGKAYGIHFAVTAPRLNALPTPIYSLFTERLTLRLAEQDDYRAIVGAVQSIDEVPGRGYVRVGRDPLEFQIAIAAGDRDGGAVRLAVTEKMHANGGTFPRRDGHALAEPLGDRVGEGGLRRAASRVALDLHEDAGPFDLGLRPRGREDAQEDQARRRQRSHGRTSSGFVASVVVPSPS